jgi:hypothetical protein
MTGQSQPLLMDTPAPEQPVLQKMLLMEKVHFTFEAWFTNLFLTGQLDNDTFSIKELRSEYLTLCWKEEVLWIRWKEATDAQKE